MVLLLGRQIAGSWEPWQPCPDPGRRYGEGVSIGMAAKSVGRTGCPRRVGTLRSQGPTLGTPALQQGEGSRGCLLMGDSDNGSDNRKRTQRVFLKSKFQRRSLSYPLYLSSTAIKFLTRHIATQNKECISKLVLQLNAALWFTFALWLLANGKEAIIANGIANAISIKIENT